MRAGEPAGSGSGGIIEDGPNRSVDDPALGHTEAVAMRRLFIIVAVAAFLPAQVAAQAAGSDKLQWSVGL
jgi:hypothetical protein